MTFGVWADGSIDGVVEYLLAHARPLLLKGDEPVAFVRETWIRWFRESGNLELVDLVEELPSQIDRRYLRALGRVSTGNRDLLELFLAVMVWGRGKKNARMKRSMRRAFSHVRESDVLRSSRRLLQDDELSEAWSAAQGIPGLGEPFFTKWLYGASLTPRVPRMALVLDGNIRAALWELGWSSRERSGTRLKSERYEFYVSATHEWSNRLNGRFPEAKVEPDTVEYALFRLGAGIPSNQRFHF